ncbi:MAG: hypothetical protein ACJAZE_000406 [Halioglobus sp.]|jgi:hypothetical protein
MHDLVIRNGLLVDGTGKLARCYYGCHGQLWRRLRTGCTRQANRLISFGVQKGENLLIKTGCHRRNQLGSQGVVRELALSRSWNSRRWQ